MAKDKNSFLLYSDLYFTLKKLTDEQAGKLFKHILSYVNDENPQTNDFIIEVAFEPIKQSLKRDLRKYESICLRNRNNGAKGGRPKQKPKKPSGIITNPNNPDEPDNDNDSDNDIDSDITKKKKNKYADYVSMTETQYQTLVTKHSEHNAKILIEILNNYKGSSGKKYKDDYLAILNWVVDRARQDGKYRTL
jgi:hypothetical protein